jgi:hypothetical protein
MIPSDSAFASLRYSSFTFGGIVGEFSSGEDMASLKASTRNQNHARHGYLIPQICWQATSDSEAGIPSLGSLLIQTIDCMFFGLAIPKVLLVSRPDPVKRMRGVGWLVFHNTRKHYRGMVHSGTVGSTSQAQ